jgi:hypothetical protein
MKKRERNENIADFKDYKKIYKLSKPRSAIIIEFMTDDLPDEWLITVLKYKNKTGAVTDNFGIIEKDLAYWYNAYQEKGWKPIQI